MMAYRRCIALLAVMLIAGMALFGGIASQVDAEGAPSSETYDVSKYLGYIPDLSSGNSAGTTVSLDQDDAYRILGFYTDSFGWFGYHTNEYNRIILDSARGTSDIDGFASKFVRLVMEAEDIRGSGVSISDVKMDTGGTVVIETGGTVESPTLTLRAAAEWKASVSAHADRFDELTECDIRADARIPMTLTVTIAFSEEKVPQSVDLRIGMGMESGMDWSCVADGVKVSDSERSEEAHSMEVSLRLMDKLTVRELNDLINPGDTVLNKRVYSHIRMTSDTGDRHYEEGVYADRVVDLSTFGVRDVVPGVEQEVSEIDRGSLASMVKGLMKGVIPSYDSVEWLLDAAGIGMDRSEYVKATIVSGPYLLQSLGILHKVWDYGRAEGLASYYIDWNGGTIHADRMDPIRQNVAHVEAFSPEKQGNVDEGVSYRIYGDDMTVSEYAYFGSSDFVDIVLPATINGIPVTGLDSYAVDVPEGKTVTIAFPDGMRYISRYAVVGSGYEGPGGKMFHEIGDTGFELILEAWMDDGHGCAEITGFLNGTVTGKVDLAIPESVSFGRYSFELREIEWNAFSGCQDIVSVDIPSTITYAGMGAFNNCRNLEEVVIRSDIGYASELFESCNSLKKVTIDANSFTIAYEMFNGTALETMVLKDGISLSIERKAFDNMKSSFDPEAVKDGNGEAFSLVALAENISESAFYGVNCPGGTVVADFLGYSSCLWKVDGEYFASVHLWSSYEGDSFTVPGKVVLETEKYRYEAMVIDAEIGSSHVKKLVIDAPLERLEFGYRLNIEEIEIRNPDCDYTIERYGGYTLVIHHDDEVSLAFCFGSDKTFTVPDKVSYIGTSALRSMTAEKVVVLGDIEDLNRLSSTVVELELGKDVSVVPYYRDGSIERITVQDGNEYFRAIDGVLFDKDGTLLRYPAAKSGSIYALPEWTVSVEYNAFGDSTIESLVLNDSLQHIHANSLPDGGNLKSVTIAEGNDRVRMVGSLVICDDEAVFYNASDDDILIIPEGVYVYSSVFRYNAPDVIVIADSSYYYSFYKYSKDIPSISTVVMFDGAHVYCDYDVHRVVLRHGWAYTDSLSTDGKTLTYSVGFFGPFAADGIFADGKRISSGTSVTLTPDDLAGISSIRVSYQPAKYTVSFDTRGGPSVQSQDVYYRYYADVPSDPYRSGYTFTGWYSDAACTQRFDFDSPITGPATVYAGWRVVQTTPVEPVDPPKPEPKPEPEPEPVVNPDGSTTVTKETEEKDSDGDVVKRTEAETTYKDGSKLSSETTTVTKEKDGAKETLTETTETVRDASGATVGSTTVTTSEKESSSGSSSTTTTVSRNGDGDEVRTVTQVDLESKDGDVATTMEVVKDVSSGTKSTISTSIKAPSVDGAMSVDHETMKAAIDQAREAMEAAGLSEEERSAASVTVEIRSDRFDDTTASVEMPSESFLAASESEADLKITSEVGSMVFDSDVSGTLASKGVDVAVSISVADRSLLRDDQRTSVGDAPLYRLSATAGSESVHELGGTATITVPYTLKEGDDPRAITVYYVNDDGRLEKKTTSYDPTTHSLTFVTTHFSYYVILNSAGLDGYIPEKPVEEDGGEDGIGIWAVAGVLVAIAVVAIAIVARRVR